MRKKVFMQLQEIYQKCEKIRWYKPCLEMISEDYQLSYDELLEVIRRYMVEELKEEESEFIELLKQIKAREIFGDFINFSLKKPEDYLLVQWYYENKANKVEQQAFENIVLFIGRSVYLELLKNNEALEVIPKKYNLSVEQIKKFYQYFCDKKLTKKRKETLNNILKNNLSESKKSLNNFKKSKFYKLCNMLLSDIPIEEIVKYINKNKLTLRLFYPEYIRKFLGVYKLEKVDIKEIEKQILTRYQKVVELMRSTQLRQFF